MLCIIMYIGNNTMYIHAELPHIHMEVIWMATKGDGLASAKQKAWAQNKINNYLSQSFFPPGVNHCSEQSFTQP